MNISVSVTGSSNPIAVSNFVFPGGEIQVKIDEPVTEQYVTVKAIITSSDEIMTLLLLTDALRRAYKGFDKLIISLELPYVPYARQDRVMVEGEALSISVFCKLINSQNYDSVTIWDPHSDVTPALLDRCEIKTQADVLLDDLPLGREWPRVYDPKIENELIKNFTENTVLVSPDAGANKKVWDAAKRIGFGQVVRADKVRDPATGKITGTVVYGEHIGNKNFLILDDICDGGYTFIQLAKELRALTNGKIILYVTHGIFSKGLDVFKGLVDEVYCANSFGVFPENVELLSYKPF